MSNSEKIKVLFLCTGNACRSQISEAWLRIMGGKKFDVYSAGLEPHGVNPFAKAVMKETGYDMRQHRSKHIDVYIGRKQFDYLISVCSDAEKRCPYFPGSGERIHWRFEDPAVFEGTDEEKMALFRQTRDLIKKQIKNWLADSFPNEH